jgi:Lrp/AsnC family transcriptional regulator, leucine-responsive regulatory protein
MLFMDKYLVNKALDNLNWKILQELQKNARVTIVELGKRINLSAPAVAERIKKLEEEGYIKGYQTVIDYDKIGLTVPVFINFKAISIKHANMIKMVESMPEVIEWFAITGNYCLLLKVVVNSTKELEMVIEKLSKYGETSTSIILSSSALPKIIQ